MQYPPSPFNSINVDLFTPPIMFSEGFDASFWQPPKTLQR